MQEEPSFANRQARWRRFGDRILLLNRRRFLLLFLIWALIALFTWAVDRFQPGSLLTLAFVLGAVVIPLYLLLALAYTIVRTQPRGRYLRLSRYTLLLIPAFFLSIVLHNLLYAVFYPYFRREDGDEGVFFVFALIGIPLHFLLVLVYTIVTFIRDKRGGGEDRHNLGRTT